MFFIIVSFLGTGRFYYAWVKAVCPFKKIYYKTYTSYHKRAIIYVNNIPRGKEVWKINGNYALEV